jgi:hypothetical protein
VQLASELNVGFELLSSCAQQGSLTYEASELCQGRKPFQLYAGAGCNSYFWCSPELAACITACPAGECPAAAAAVLMLVAAAPYLTLQESASGVPAAPLLPWLPA